MGQTLSEPVVEKVCSNSSSFCLKPALTLTAIVDQLVFAFCLLLLSGSRTELAMRPEPAWPDP